MDEQCLLEVPVPTPRQVIFADEDLNYVTFPHFFN
jgi:hypothetical protein